MDRRLPSRTLDSLMHSNEIIRVPEATLTLMAAAKICSRTREIIGPSSFREHVSALALSEDCGFGLKCLKAANMLELEDRGMHFETVRACTGTQALLRYFLLLLNQWIPPALTHFVFRLLDARLCCSPQPDTFFNQRCRRRRRKINEYLFATHTHSLTEYV